MKTAFLRKFFGYDYSISLIILTISLTTPTSVLSGDGTSVLEKRKYPNADPTYLDSMYPGHSYDGAFQDAVEWAIIRNSTGKDYVSFLGPHRYFGGTPRDAIKHPCTVTVFEHDYMQNPYRCWIATWSIRKDCHNADGCSEFRVDPSFAINEKYKKWIITAILEPCRFIKNPSMYNSNTERNIQGNHIFSDITLWNILKCGSEQEIQGKDVQIIPESGLIRFQF